MDLNPDDDKNTFHHNARRELKALAWRCGLKEYDLRTNLGGLAVLGETTLHGATVYIQTTQNMGMLIRSCKGRKDYTGGQNCFVPYHLDEVMVSWVKKLSTQYV
jgi:hypothetical protein